MEFITDIISKLRFFLEFAYFISGVVVAVASIYALKQVSILKKTLYIQSKRDSLKLTNEQCKDYMERIIKLQDKFDNDVKSEGITYFNHWDIKNSPDGISAKRTKDITDEEWEKYDHSEIAENIPFNAMEAFSSYFICGAADEFVAYNAVGLSFIETINDYMPFILNARENGHYKNLIELYEIWEQRHRTELLNAKKREINKELNSVKQTYKVALGTESS